jgi:hypothetical protein
VKPQVKIFVQTKPSLPLSGFARCSDPDFDFVVSDDTTYSRCDVAILYGCAKDVERTPKTAIKGSIHRSHIGPKLIVETGFTGRINTARRRFPKLRAMLGRAGVAFSAAHTYYRVGLDGAFGDDADFANEGSPPDRWLKQCEECGISVRPYRRSGKHILLIGQVPGDASLRGLWRPLDKYVLARIGRFGFVSTPTWTSSTRPRSAGVSPPFQGRRCSRRQARLFLRISRIAGPA